MKRRKGRRGKRRREGGMDEKKKGQKGKEKEGGRSGMKIPPNASYNSQKNEKHSSANPWQNLAEILEYLD